MANSRRPYYLFDHQLKVRKPGQSSSQAVTIPIISRALETTGLALGLELATREQLETIRENIVYYRRGSLASDRCLIVYTERVGNEDKVKTVSLPIPKYAPNYKLLPVIRAANAGQGALAGKIIGIRRHGYLIPLGESQGGRGGGSGQ